MFHITLPECMFYQEHPRIKWHQSLIDHGNMPLNTFPFLTPWKMTLLRKLISKYWRYTSKTSLMNDDYRKKTPANSSKTNLRTFWEDSFLKTSILSGVSQGGRGFKRQETPNLQLTYRIDPWKHRCGRWRCYLVVSKNQMKWHVFSLR